MCIVPFIQCLRNATGSPAELELELEHERTSYLLEENQRLLTSLAYPKSNCVDFLMEIVGWLSFLKQCSTTCFREKAHSGSIVYGPGRCLRIRHSQRQDASFLGSAYPETRHFALRSGP
jgi:hypothetical protein